MVEAAGKALLFYQRGKENIFDYLLSAKIKDKGQPISKRWIYLCDMYASSEKDRVFNFLLDVVNKEIPELNYPFAQKVASLVKTKIENEIKNVVA